MPSSSDDITSLDEETPRRHAVRTMGAAGAVLLSVVSLGGSQAEGKNGSLRADKKKKRKSKKCHCPLIGLTFAESDPFSVAAGAHKTEQAVCPAGFLALSGGLEGTGKVTVPCMISESHVTADGNAWVVNVFCIEATNTNLVVGAICFNESSFQPENPSRRQNWFQVD